MTIENLEYDALLEKFKKILRENGLKYTQQREVLLKTLYNNDEHFTPERLYFFHQRDSSGAKRGYRDRL